MSYGGHSYAGGVSPSFASQQLPGAMTYQQQAYSPNSQSAYLPQQGYSGSQPGYSQQQRAYSPQPPQQQRAYSPQPPPMHRYSPQPPQQQLPPQAAAGQPQIQPGAITYTTSNSAEGLVYHCFKAVPASYQTPNGVVSGIQWIPAEATSVLPVGAQPAGAEFAASWNRGHLSDMDKKSIEKWQREEEKRRRKDEKEAAKVVHGWERDRKDHQKQLEREERELAKAREKDRRRSGNFSGSTAASNTGGSYVPGGYDQNEYGSGDHAGLLNRMEEMNIGGAGAGYGHERKSSQSYAIPRSRRNSINAALLENAARGNVGSDYSDRSPYGSQVGAYPPAASGYGAPPASGYGAPAGQYSNAPGRPLSRVGPTSPYVAGRSPLPVETSLPGHGPPGAGYGPPSAGYGAPSYGVSDAGRSFGPAAHAPNTRPVSPYVASAVSGSEVGMYPRGHVLEGRAMPRSPIPGLPNNLYGGAPDPYAHPGAGGGMPTIVGFQGSASRPPSRIGGGMGMGGVQPGQQPGYGPGPGGMAAAMDPIAQAMTAPEGFSRRPNPAQPYNPFEPMKIQDMEDFVENIPRMPLALVSHDVTNGDWNRFMTDISLAWTGRLPVPPGSRLPRPSTAVADLVDLWNDQFFTARAAEIVLYKGRERRTGPDAGMLDDLPTDREDLSSSSSESSDSEDSEDDHHGGGYYERQQARRAHKAERKAEKKRRRKEKKMRRKAKEQGKKYTLYVTYLTGAPSVGRSNSMYGR